MTKLQAALWMAAGVFLAACHMQGTTQTMITQTQALSIAREEFVRQGLQLADYEVSGEPADTDPDHWIVSFEKKGPFPIPGGRHLVRVGKDSGKAEFLPGE